MLGSELQGSFISGWQVWPDGQLASVLQVVTQRPTMRGQGFPGGQITAFMAQD